MRTQNSIEPMTLNTRTDYWTFWRFVRFYALVFVGACLLGVGCATLENNWPAISDALEEQIAKAKEQAQTSITNAPADPVEVEQPAPVAGQPDWSAVVVAQPGKSVHMGTFRETVRLASATMRPGLVQWTYADAGAMQGWNEVTMNVPVCGCLFYLVERDGVWYQVVTEWVKRSGGENRLAEAFLAVRHNGKNIFEERYQVRNGETIWLGVASLNYYGVLSAVRERSNLVPVIVGGMP